MLALKLSILLLLLAIFWQDLKERQVYSLLFIGFALFIGFVQFQATDGFTYLIETSINLLFLILLFALLWLYTKFKMNQNFFATFGLGDVYFFVALAFGFDISTFLVLFVFSLIFSLTLFLLLKQRMNSPTVPLAGFQALFFMLILSYQWFFKFVIFENLSIK